MRRILFALLFCLITTGARAQTFSPDGTVVTAPSGSTIVTSYGTFSLGAQSGTNPGNYALLLNGVDMGGYFIDKMEVANNGQFFIHNNHQPDWYLYQGRYNSYPPDYGPTANNFFDIFGPGDPLGAGAPIKAQIHNAPGWIHSHSYSVGDSNCGTGPKCRVNNGPGWNEGTQKYVPRSLLRAYQLISGSCTSAASGGPTGTGSDIIDNTCHWKYLSDTDYVTLTGWSTDAPQWVAGTQAIKQIVVSNDSNGVLTAYIEWNFEPNAGATCNSTIAPSHTSGIITLADGCAWNWLGQVIYTSGLNRSPPHQNYPDVNNVGYVQMLKAYEADLWNDRTYVMNANGENGYSQPLLQLHKDNENDFITRVEPPNMGDATGFGLYNNFIIKPAPGEGFQDYMLSNPSAALTGPDQTRGVMISGTFASNDNVIVLQGLQFFNGTAEAIRTSFRGANSWRMMNDVIETGSVTPLGSSGTRTPIRLGLEVEIINSLVINHGAGAIGAWQDYVGSFVHSTIVDPEGTGDTCVLNGWNYAWIQGQVFIDTVCVGFTHMTGSIAPNDGGGFYDYYFRASNNFTTAAQPNNCPAGVGQAGCATFNTMWPPPDPGTPGTPVTAADYPVPSTQYSMSSSGVFVGPNDYRIPTNSPLYRSGASYGTLNLNPEGRGTSGGWTQPDRAQYDRPDIVGTARPASGADVGAWQTPGPPPTTVTLTITPPSNGTVTSADGFINCGATCGPHTYNTGTPVTLTATPAGGYSFVSWGGSCSGSGATCNLPMNANATVSASFSSSVPTTFNLTIGSHTNGTITSNVGGINCGATCSATYAAGTSVTFTATPSGGFAFSSWGGACAGVSLTNTCTIPINANNMVVSASFSSSSNSADGTTITAPTGTLVNAAGTWTWGGVYGGGGDYFILLNGSTPPTPGAGVLMEVANGGNLYIKNSSNQWFVFVNNGYSPAFPLTVTAPSNGTVTSSPGVISCGATCDTIFSGGTTVALTAAPAGGYNFTSWGGSCSGTGVTCNLTMNATATVTATFTAQVGPPPNDNVRRGGKIRKTQPKAPPSPSLLTVTAPTGGTITSSPGTINCGSTCVNSFTTGTVVTLTETPDGTHAFQSWGGACSGFVGTTCTVTMNSDLIVSAAFSLNTNSPDGTIINAATGTLVTAAGTWSWGTVSGADYHILLNGVSAAGGLGTKMETANGGQLYVMNAASQWFVWNGSGYTAVSGDPLVISGGPLLAMPGGIGGSQTVDVGSGPHTIHLNLSNNPNSVCCGVAPAKFIVFVSDGVHSPVQVTSTMTITNGGATISNGGTESCQGDPGQTCQDFYLRGDWGITVNQVIFQAFAQGTTYSVFLGGNVAGMQYDGIDYVTLGTAAGQGWSGWNSSSVTTIPWYQCDVQQWIDCLPNYTLSPSSISGWTLGGVGQSAAPLSTITQGGGTIVLPAGTFVGAGRTAASTFISGAGAASTIIDLGHSTGSGTGTDFQPFGSKAAFGVENPGFSLSNLAIHGAKIGGSGISGLNGAAIMFEGYGGTIDNVELYDNQEGVRGEAVSGDGLPIVVKNSYVHNNGSRNGFTHEIYIGGGNRNGFFNNTVVQGPRSTHALKTSSLDTSTIEGGSYSGCTDVSGFNCGSVIEAPRGGKLDLIGFKTETVGAITHAGDVLQLSFTQSGGGAAVVSNAPGGASLTTAEGTWTWGSLSGSDYFLLLNGASSNGGGVQAETFKGDIYVKNSANKWYRHNATSGWIQVAGNPDAGASPIVATSTIAAGPPTATTVATTFYTALKANSTLATAGFDFANQTAGVINVYQPIDRPSEWTIMPSVTGTTAFVQATSGVTITMPSNATGNAMIAIGYGPEGTDGGIWPVNVADTNVVNNAAASPRISSYRAGTVNFTNCSYTGTYIMKYEGWTTAHGRCTNPNFPLFTPSANHTTSNAPGGGSVTSIEGVWTWGSASGSDYILVLNGTPVQGAAVLMEIADGGNLYVQNAAGSWFTYLNGFGATGAPP